MSETALVTVPQARQIPRLGEWWGNLSRVEQISLVFFAYITAAAAAFHVQLRELGIILILNTLTISTVIALRRFQQRSRWVSATANLFPALLLLVAYRESGLLLTSDTTHLLDETFIRWDRVLIHNVVVNGVLQAGAPWIQYYLEFAYLFCYPLVPLGVAAVRFGAPRDLKPDTPAVETRIEGFWTIVLAATLFTYAIYPFFPLTPPRVMFADVPGPHVEPLLRKLNFWLLNHYSVQACIFPSGHVAATTAAALAVRKYAPRFSGLFLFAAASVAAATVYGRYHYSADAIAGAVVAVAAYQLSKIFK